MSNIFDTSELDKTIDEIKSFEKLFEGIDLLLCNLHILNNKEIEKDIKDILIGFNGFFLGKRYMKTDFSVNEFLEQSHRF